MSTKRKSSRSEDLRGVELHVVELRTRDGISVKPLHLLPFYAPSLQGFRTASSSETDLGDLRDNSSSRRTSIGDLSQHELVKPLPAVPYHVLEKKQKKLVVYIISLAAFFSPLSSNIYLPALDQISHSFSVSNATVLLSITIYMVVQGLAPSFWGALADCKGRRQTLMFTLISYVVANLGLALSPNFATLMVFRGLQAFGSSATIAIGSGVIADIAPKAERGGLVGVFSGIRMFGQSIGPVIGGILTEFLGFRSIFYFLVIIGAIVVIVIFLVLPETLRTIAGDGTIKLKGLLYRPPLTILLDEKPDSTIPRTVVTGAFSWKDVIQPLRYLLAKDVFVSLIFGSVVYAVWSMLTASTTSLFKELYGLNNLQLGLAFIPNGLGCVVGSITTGVLLDHDYKQTEKKFRKDRKIDPSVPLTAEDSLDFPLESARLRNLWWIVAVFIGSLVGFGFSLHTDIDLPLLMQFIASATATSVFNINSALVIDLFPGKSASATAMNNLVRCSVGAVGVGLTEPLLELTGPKIGFSILAGIVLVSSSLVWVQYKYGMKWRVEREKRDGLQQTV